VPIHEPVGCDAKTSDGRPPHASSPALCDRYLFFVGSMRRPVHIDARHAERAVRCPGAALDGPDPRAYTKHVHDGPAVRAARGDATVKASVGDRLVVSGHRVGEAERQGEIVEVRGPGGTPPYLVRWANGVESVVYPGSDYRIVVRRVSRRGAPVR
jgi:hypothetical protein